MRARILIIEDNRDNLELMMYLLRAFGYSPLTAHEGAAGLEIIQQEELDLILCDISMSGMDGYAVANALKSHKTWSNIPLVAITALAMVGDREKILAAGFDGYIAKPIEPEHFIEQVESFLPVDFTRAAG
jgi:CheY-like chemotaxis protein